MSFASTLARHLLTSHNVLVSTFGHCGQAELVTAWVRDWIGMLSILTRRKSSCSRGTGFVLSVSLEAFKSHG